LGEEMSTEFFTINADHLKLLQKANITWYGCEFGAPGVDCKRPYGNSGVYEDIAEILGLTRNEEDEFTQDQYNLMSILHEGTKTALQICLQIGKFETGCYSSERYFGEWSKVL
jgi:hypothetical protein